jgi:hypothetical protein
VLYPLIVPLEIFMNKYPMSNKILVFNGCSFVAGDDIAWDYSNGPYPTRMHDFRVNDDYFSVIRPNNNLSAFTKELSGAISKVDLSRDGNNNTEIALATINYIESQPIELRKNFHVCVGWTESLRICKWFNTKNQFISLGPWMVDLKNSVARDSEWHHQMDQESSLYVKPFYENFYDIDFLLEYIKNIMLLENYLKAQGIDYTFWRSLGDPLSEDSHDVKWINQSMLEINKASDSSKWLQLSPNPEGHPITGESVLSVMQTNPKLYSTPGRHPNTYAAKLLAGLIAAKIS